MSALRLPLRATDLGEIVDAAGDEVAVAWGREEESDLAGTVTATTHSLGERSASAQARAAEIVRRVNLHDELVAALKEAHGYMPLGERRAHISAVLAKVEGR